MDVSVTRGRLAAMAVLFCNGLLYSTWGVSIPAIKDKFHLSEAVLAMAMAAVAIGGIGTMAQAGRWIGAQGSSKASVQSGLLMAALAAPILIVPNYALLLLLLCGFGIATAANDVAANAQGALLERTSGKSLIASLHGSFSAGGLCGALLASAWPASGLSIASNFFLLALAVGVVMLIAARFLKQEPTRSTDDSSYAVPDSVDSGTQRLARSRLRAMGALAFTALVVEGVFYDWAAVYMRDVVDGHPTWVGAGYAAFAVGMACGRLGGDWLRDRLPHQGLFALSGAMSLTGLSVVLLVGPPWRVVLGFLITGVGLSNMIPILFSSAGKLSNSAGLPAASGLATTTRIAYVGLLAGPVVVGPVAHAVGLKLSLVIVAFAVVATCAGWIVLSKRSGGNPWELKHTDGLPARQACVTSTRKFR
jgi:MFS family permease